MGNQMFQYAAGLALAEKHRTVLKLDTSWFKRRKDQPDHSRYALSCFNIIEQFATGEECRRLKNRKPTSSGKLLTKLFARRSRLPGASPADQAGTRMDVGFSNSLDQEPDDTYIAGLFQSERYFESVADLLRLQFSIRYPPSDAASRIGAEIARGPSVSVHIRRGDYVSQAGPRQRFGPLSLDYFNAALKAVQQQAGDLKVFVFSDDIASIREDFRPAANCVFVDISTWFNAHDDLRLMSQCDHHIISNSTFGWWGAWLNPSPDKIVIAPDPWFLGLPLNGRNIIPPTWRTMPRPPVQD